MAKDFTLVTAEAQLRLVKLTVGEFCQSVQERSGRFGRKRFRVGPVKDLSKPKVNTREQTDNVSTLTKSREP